MIKSNCFFQRADEYSWKKSRQGLALDERGDRTLKLEAMKVDAARERAERNTK